MRRTASQNLLFVEWINPTTEIRQLVNGIGECAIARKTLYHFLITQSQNDAQPAKN